jgi:hypothetical protein
MDLDLKVALLARNSIVCDWGILTRPIDGA